MEKIELSDEQKEFIDKNYKKISNLNELTCAVFMGEDLDGRTKEGRAVRAYMAQKDYKYNTTRKPKVPPLNLTESHKEFILAQADGTMKAFDIAKLLFPEKDVTPLSQETRVITEFLKKHNPENLNPRDSAVGEKYKPVDSFDKIIEKVNTVTNQELSKDRMQMTVKKGLEALIRFLKSPRLIQTIGNYTDKEDRELFEAEFIRATWDKADLTSDELNLYINVCIDYINLKNIQKAVDKLNHMFEQCEDQQDMTVRLAELLKTKSEEYNQCEKRMESLITRLNGDRAKRVQNKQSHNASILNLVQMFQEEEEREVMIKIAEMQKAMVMEEAGNLESMPDWKARVLGLRKNDIA
jgi:phage gpG-like protein